MAVQVTKRDMRRALETTMPGTKLRRVVTVRAKPANQATQAQRRRRPLSQGVARVRTMPAAV
jgi:hypothetical protein